MNVVAYQFLSKILLYEKLLQKLNHMIHASNKKPLRAYKQINLLFTLIIVLYVDSYSFAESGGKSNNVYYFIKCIPNKGCH